MNSHPQHFGRSSWLLLLAQRLRAAGCDREIRRRRPSIRWTPRADAASAARSRPAQRAAAKAAPTLIVNPPHAAAGFDSRRIIYVRELHKLEYFAHSEWVDTPARMLAPLIVAALENGGAFRAVVLTPSAASGDFRLDTEIVRLQHEFGTGPSRVRFTLRAYLVEVNRAGSWPRANSTLGPRLQRRSVWRRARGQPRHSDRTWRNVGLLRRSGAHPVHCGRGMILMRATNFPSSRGPHAATPRAQPA